ncbi:MAG: TPM domain-containing protein [Verrucomicrobiota bacterium]|nr:TPM domain-containing protein [Verrucomicrobiota bacterium]
MRTKEFLSRLDHDRILEAIRRAESKTSGEIRIYIHRGDLKGDALAEAQKQFVKLGVQKTRERNGVLIFVAPRAQQFAVVGDEGVHAKCGEGFWQQLVEKMRAHFRGENFTAALVEAIDEAGELLAAHFPRTSADVNELSDEIVEGD